MQHDAAKPGEEAATAIEAAQRFPGFDQRFLHEVFGQRRIAADRDRLPEQAVFVRPAEIAEGIGITRLGSGQQIRRVVRRNISQCQVQALHIRYGIFSPAVFPLTCTAGPAFSMIISFSGKPLVLSLDWSSKPRSTPSSVKRRNVNGPSPNGSAIALKAESPCSL